MGKLREKLFSGNVRRSIRIGDKVERVTNALGVKPCTGCKRRKDWLNGEATDKPDNNKDSGQQNE